ncbi:MAG: hypothetical protein WCR36_10860, partial [Bacteroidaceae bacterium]
LFGFVHIVRTACPYHPDSLSEPFGQTVPVVFKTMGTIRPIPIWTCQCSNYDGFIQSLNIVVHSEGVKLIRSCSDAP